MRCALCGGPVADAGCPRCSPARPAVEGALARHPQHLTPQPRLPTGSKRGRDSAWREEVRERLRVRKKRRLREDDLPLFGARSTPLPVADSVVAREPTAPLAAVDAETPIDLPLQGAQGVDTPVDVAPLDSTSAGVLPLQSAPLADPGTPAIDVATIETVPEGVLPFAGDGEIDLSPERDELPRSLPAVERAARAWERLAAGLVDGGILLATAGFVAYFAGRVGDFDVLQTGHAWPWLFGFLAMLAWIYAGFFTGTTGQTPGKMVQGIRVVDSAGRAPSYGRAFGRAAVGTLGSLLLGLAQAPSLFDPARRAAHDRVFRTRVVSRG